MTIKAGEIGKIFRLATGFDMSSSSALSLEFTHSDGVTTFTATNPAVTAPASPATDPDIGSLAASTYFQYTTTGTDFTKAGTWTVCGTYEDATPNKYFADTVTFTVLAGC